MSSNNNKAPGMDLLLTQRGKALQCGESIRFTLIKGSNSTTGDPVNPKASSEEFPLVMKVGESVVKPNFHNEPWNKSRLYQQDAPKAQDDSDEEVDQDAPTRKRKRFRRPEAPKRQWILQEEPDFLKTMIAKRQRKIVKQEPSSKYVGIPESNASHYVILHTSGNKNVQVTPLSSTWSFSQPTKMHTLSMAQAEQVIQDQRGKMTRYMMHDNNKSGANKNHSKSRLLGKLNSNQEEEEDDVMADVAFRSRKGSSSSKARQELLSTMVEEGITTVDNDGVLGGTNNSEFGGKRRFGRFQAEKKKTEQQQDQPMDHQKANDGLAMADNFYQRDVQAEYEELDYDANELFDDDDVDVGEKEVMVDEGGFAADEEDDFEEEFMEDQSDGAEGLATVAGFRALLAKARGESPAPEEGEKKEEEGKKEEDAEGATATTAATAANQQQPAAADEEGTGDKLTQAAAAAAAAAADKKKPKNVKKNTGVEVDENGQRLVTLEAIQREIWLHHGSIRVKRLMKIFDISKKTAVERRNKFRDLIKELCTMKQDAVDGNMLVLKQHYSNMK